MSLAILSKSNLSRLYLRERRSVSDIAGLFGCSEHKINYWLYKYRISKRSISEAIYAKRNPFGDPFMIKKVGSRSDAELLGLGLGLYWGEGNKRNKTAVRLGNTDPALIRTFMHFLQEICGVPDSKFRFSLQIFGDIPAERALRFWLNELKYFNATRFRFSKVTVTPHRGVGNYRRKSEYGVLTVHVNNSKLKRAIDNLLERRCSSAGRATPW